MLIILAGAFAQLVDGGIGMGFGVTSTTILLLSMGPAQASAVVHAAEVGTTLASGLSHWRFGNVNWRVVLTLGVPGAISAATGASPLTVARSVARFPPAAAAAKATAANSVRRTNFCMAVS